MRLHLMHIRVISEYATVLHAGLYSVLSLRVVRAICLRDGRLHSREPLGCWSIRVVEVVSDYDSDIALCVLIQSRPRVTRPVNIIT